MMVLSAPMSLSTWTSILTTLRQFLTFPGLQKFFIPTEPIQLYMPTFGALNSLWIFQRVLVELSVEEKRQYRASADPSLKRFTALSNFCC